MGFLRGNGIDNFLSSLSKSGLVVFFITVVISLLILVGKFGVIFFYGFSIYASLGIAFVVTTIFEVIYGFFTNKSNLK